MFNEKQKGLATVQGNIILIIFDIRSIKKFMSFSAVSERVELFLSCRNLKDLDYFSKSDPYIKVNFRRDFNVKQYAPYGRT